VNGAGNQFLAGARLAVKQDGGVGRCNDRDLFQDFLQGCALADNAFEAVLRADFWFDMKLLISEPAHIDKALRCQVSEVCEIHSRAPHSLLPNLLHLRCFAELGEWCPRS
jgi:hypothetical protein